MTDLDGALDQLMRRALAVRRDPVAYSMYAAIHEDHIRVEPYWLVRPDPLIHSRRAIYVR